MKRLGITTTWLLSSLLFASLFLWPLANADAGFGVVEKQWNTFTRKQINQISGRSFRAGIALKKSKSRGSLYTQKILGLNQKVTWPINGLKYQEIKARPQRPVWVKGDEYRVLFAFPSENAHKNSPLQDWIVPQIDAALKEMLGGKKPTYGEPKTFSVKETGVGEQPYGEMGPLGAWNRAKHCVDNLPKEAFTDYHAIVVLSLESSITSQGKGGYDSPNVIAYELYSGYTVHARGAGPAVQGPGLKDFHRRREADLIKSTLKTHGLYQECPVPGLCGAQTYGMVLKETFGVSNSDWHKPVCGISRMQLIGNLLDGEKLKFHVETAFGIHLVK